MITIWVLVFIISLSALILAADVFTNRSERVALALGVSPFAIGITLVALGTSIPELATAISAIIKGNQTIALANAIGSNIVNILLILGISAIVVKRLKAERNLIDIDLPLLFLSSVIFILIILDKVVTPGEGVFLVLGYVVYLAYAFFFKGKEKIVAMTEVVEKKLFRPKMDIVTFILILVSIAVIYVSADFTVQAVIVIGTAMAIPTSVIAITVIALGTSLPELVISLRATMKGKHDIAIGNIIGSSIFNIFIVVGVPALISTLVVDDIMWTIGIPFFIATTFTIIFSGITQRIYRWEGAMFILVYILFLFQIVTYKAL